jgi:hypothetical protein
MSESEVRRSKTPVQIDTPHGWGEDELSKFWQQAFGNQLATFAHNQPEFQRLAAIDQAFHTILKDWTNPVSEISTLLFLRCHCAYRAAAGLAAAGHSVECYGVARMTLEFAGYALHVFRKPTAGTIWLNRHKDDASRKTSIREFSRASTLPSILAANRHACRRFENLYEETIDLGAHPNKHSVFGHVTVVEEDDRRLVNSLYLHGDDLAFKMALKTTARCGVCSLELLQCICNSRFELLGVNRLMPGLKAGL